MTYSDYILQDHRMDYNPFWSKEHLLDWLMQTEQYQIRRYVKALRAEEYYTFHSPNRMLRYWCFRKKNRLGAKLGFFIPAGCFGPDLKIAHYGSVIINPHSKVGSGCTIHGNCCLGNKHLTDDENDSPILGNNINIGQGAQILGHITIADDVTIAAGAVVVNDVLTPGTVVAGVPAKVIGYTRS